MAISIVAFCRLVASAVVAASSANLGPEADSVGLALSLYGESSRQRVRLTVTVDGEGGDQVPLEPRHLVVRAVQHRVTGSGVSAAGLAVRFATAIPHSRGLGSSAAAVVGGLAAVNGLDKYRQIRHHRAMLAQFSWLRVRSSRLTRRRVLGSAVVRGLTTVVTSGQPCHCGFIDIRLFTAIPVVDPRKRGCYCPRSWSTTHGSNVSRAAGGCAHRTARSA